MLTGTTMGSSPLWTGQPFGPQATQDKPNTDKWVPPVAQARDPDAELTRGQPPQKFWRLVGGGPDPVTHIAPPSIVQIRITQLLNDQAPANENARTKEAEARAEIAEKRAETAEREAEAARGDADRPAPTAQAETARSTALAEARPAGRPDASSAAAAALEDLSAIAAAAPAAPETEMQV